MIDTQSQIQMEQEQQRVLKKFLIIAFKKEQIWKTLVSHLTYKEMRSYHSYPHNRKKAEQMENQQLFLVSFIKLRSQEELLPQKLERQVNRITVYLEQKPRSRSLVLETALEGTLTL